MSAGCDVHILSVAIGEAEEEEIAECSKARLVYKVSSRPAKAALLTTLDSSSTYYTVHRWTHRWGTNMPSELSLHTGSFSVEQFLELVRSHHFRSNGDLNGSVFRNG